MSDFTRHGTLLTIPRRRGAGVAWAVLVALAAGSCSAGAAGSHLAGGPERERAERRITALEAQAAKDAERQAMLSAEADHWREAAADASAETSAVAADLAAALSRITTMTARIAALEAEARRAAPPAPRLVPQASRPATGAVSPEWVAAIARDEAARRGFTAASTEWVVAAAVRVAGRESTFRPAARNGQHLGLMQFASGWGTAAQRLCPEWSVRRFVQAYADGGAANVRRHWRATIGSM